MKIVTVLHSLKSGGAERHALQLMKGLRARGHEALYAGPMKGWLGQQLRAEGFGGIDLPLSGLYDLPSVVRLALYARRVGADLIHGHLTRGAWYAGLAARLAGLPNVATAHSDNAGKHFGRRDDVGGEAGKADGLEKGRRTGQCEDQYLEQTMSEEHHTERNAQQGDAIVGAGCARCG